MDDSPLFVGAKLLAVLGLVAANGFFVAAEFSLVGMRRSRVEELEGQGHSTAKVLRRAVDNLDANLAATQLGITISSLALGWIGEPALAHLIEPWLAGLGGMAQAASHAVAVGVAFALITVFHIVLGELAPKSLAIQRPERVAIWIVRPLGLFLTLFKPAIFLLNGLGNAVLRMCGLEPGHAEGRLHSTEELKLLVAASKDAGLVQQGQQDVVERAFGMGERRVRAIMTPRLDVYWVDADTSFEAMLRGIRQSPHEQIVVARGSLDDIVGVLRKQDLLDLHLDGKLRPAAESDGTEELLAALRKPLVVHDGATVLQVLETFRDQAIQMAVIVDEYGALRGVVTQTDLLEALAGQSSAGEDERAVKQREDGSFLVDGTTPIQEAFHQIGIGASHDSEGEYRTIAGFVLFRLGHIPSSGDRFEWASPEATWRFEVVDMDGHRVDKVLIDQDREGDRKPAS
ncbi:hemolysin family protein [uncultured Enterovirga sp.]|uniref:hemolysin family protein n=1 Tax=uncultured Enterovirga sp. TaxID=2026352 RepID=UPI0035CA3820